MDSTHQGNSNGAARSDAVVVDLAELFRQDDPEGKTVQEISRETGLTHHQVRDRLRPMVERGDVEMVGRREGRRMDGVRCQLPVYRMRKQGV